MEPVPARNGPRIPFLIAADGITTGMQVRMLDALYGQARVTLAGAVLATLVGLIVWYKLHWLWLWFWIGATWANVLFRQWMGSRYRHRADDDHLAAWARRFASTAWAVGGLWGIVLFAILGFGNDDNLKIIAIIAAAGMVAGGASRNHASPAAAIGLVLLVEIPTITGMLAGGTALANWVVSTFSILNTLVTLSNGRHLAEQTANILQIEARNLELVAELNRINDSLIASNAALETTSVTDELTGVTNRRGLMAALDRIWRHGARMASPVGIIIIDIDHFKKFNDHYGHLEGDHCLRIVAASLAATLSRPGDLCARYGGEEFVVVLPGTDEEGCIHMAERLRTAVEARTITHAASDLGRVSISLGIAAMVPHPHRDPPDLLTIADQALYRAKTLGRNRWEVGDTADHAVSAD